MDADCARLAQRLRERATACQKRFEAMLKDKTVRGDDVMHKQGEADTYASLAAELESGSL